MPAALDLWRIAPTHPTAKQWSRALEGRTPANAGLAPLPLPMIAAKAHARNFVTGAMTHAFSAGMVAGDVPCRRADMGRRYRCAGRA